MKRASHKKTRIVQKDILALSLCVVVPAIFGVISRDLVIRGSLFATGLLTSYLAGMQKRINSIFAIINALLIAYVALKNNLFGQFAVNAFVFAPLELYGFITWGRHLDTKKNVKIRKLSPRGAALLLSGCILGSMLGGYLLTRIPNQNLAFLDATICCLDIAAIIIINLRYREAWWLWIISGALSVAMWVTTLNSGGENAFMRLLSALGFFVISIYGLLRWSRKLRRKR